MIKIKQNLAVLKHVKMDCKGQNGVVRGIFIPLEVNHLFESKETGAVYLESVAFPTKEAKEWGDHLVKQSLPKAVRDAMSEEERKNTPIMGNLDTREKSATTEVVNNPQPTNTFKPENDLPF